MSIDEGDRSAAMQLGISTIVILVIAMVMIGAGISFIRTIFSSGEQVVLESVPSEDLTLNPTASSPFELSKTRLEGQQGTSTSLQVGIYNEDTSSTDVNVSMSNCKNISGDDASDQFNFVSTNRTVQPSSSTGFRILVNLPSENNAVDASPYLCKLKANMDGNNMSRDVEISVTG